MIKLRGFKKNQNLANCLLLDDRRGIRVEYQKSPEPFPMVCRNDGREYTIFKVKGGVQSALEVPDRVIYYDPREYGVVLTMPAHAKLFEKRHQLWQNLAPWALVVGILIIGIILVMVQKPGGG